MRIIFLDSYTLSPGDIDLSPLEQLGTFKSYDRTSKDEVLERAENAEILISNKVKITPEIMDAIPHIKYIIVAATGYNNVDIAAAKERNIPVSNVSGYSTTSVAQHVFAMLLGYLNQSQTYYAENQQGAWATKEDFSYWHSPILELEGKNIGIYGLGTIGKKVAQIAQSFGMNILTNLRYEGRDIGLENVRFVDDKTIFETADVVSLHAPLTDATNELIDANTLRLMKPSAILINTARGGLVHEQDLAEALEQDNIRAALLDVLSQEPPQKDNPLFQAKNCFITPHQAWASQSARKKLLDGIISNIKGYQEGNLKNVVNG